MNIEYETYISEYIDGIISYSEYIAEQIDKNISYADYLAEDPELERRKKLMEERDKKLDQLLKDV